MNENDNENVSETETVGDASVNETENTSGEAVQKSKSGTAGVKVRKILNIVLDAVLYAFLVLCVFMLIVSLVSKRNDGAINIFGTEMRIVVSPSMEKSEYSVDVSGYEIKDIPVKSMVFVERVPEDAEKAKEWYSKLKVGDVLTFSYRFSLTEKLIVSHRITEITPTATGYIICLRGDNRVSDDANDKPQILYTSEADYPSNNSDYAMGHNKIIGKVTGQSVVLGNISYVLSQPVGLACIIIVPCAIIIIWQIARVVIVLSAERRKKAALRLAEAEKIAAAESAEREKQAQELEELKRKLAELEGGKSEADGDSGSV